MVIVHWWLRVSKAALMEDVALQLTVCSRAVTGMRAMANPQLARWRDRLRRL